MDIEETSEYIDLLDPSFNQFITASNVVDLCVSPLQYDGTFRKETFGVQSINDASNDDSRSFITNNPNNSMLRQMTGAANDSPRKNATPLQYDGTFRKETFGVQSINDASNDDSRSFITNNLNNSMLRQMTGLANDSPHKNTVNYEDLFTNTNVDCQHDQSDQLAHFDSFPDFNVELDMDWLDNISTANAVTEHTSHGVEPVPSDAKETIKFYSECVNMDSPGRGSSSYAVHNEADLNEFGKMYENIVVICSLNNVENDQTCEPSIDVSGILPVNHETVNKQANDAVNDNIEGGFNVVAPSDTLDMEIVDFNIVRRTVEDFISEKPGGSENSTLNSVINFLETREDEGVDSTVTYFLNSKNDGSVEVEMSFNFAEDVTDPEIVDASYVELDYTNDDESEASGGGVESDADLGPIKKFQVFPLGSNNYRDNKGYLYSQNSSRHTHRYLRCKNNVKYSCKARVTVRDNNYEDPLMTIKHNHPPDNILKEQSIFDKKLEENIEADPFLSPRRLYLKTKEDLLGKIDATNIPPLKKREGFIHRRQKKYIPRLPSTIEDFEKYITDEKYRKLFSNDHRNLPYYRGVWTSVKGECNLVFISETVLKKINEMNFVAFFIDGTFKALPHHLKFRQLYVISVIYEDQCYPFAYVFMEKKTFTSYDTVFANLKLLMPSVAVSKVMSDYESATRKALKKHYPNAKISGCFFHYVQAIVKRAKKMGLRRDAKFNEAVKQVCALALLPNDFVLQGFKSIEETFKIKSKRWTAFKTYWMKQWSSANISVYGLVHRTNNFSESNNKSLNLLLQSRHPNIWILIKNLKSLENDKSDLILRSSKANELFEEDEDVQKFLRRVTFEENLEVFVKDQVNIVDDSDDYDEDEVDVDDVIANDYNVEFDFRKSHPRAAASRI